MQLGEAFGEPLGARAQRPELALDLVDPVEHRAGNALDAADVLGGLSRGVGAQLGGARLGRLEDDAHLLRRPGGQRRGRRRAPAQRLELVGDATQVLVDSGLVVAAPADREIAALDGVSVHALSIVARRAHDAAHR